MKFKLNHLWLLAGIIWLAALFTTNWNHGLIDDVAAVREKNERLRKEMIFQHRNDLRLSQIQKMQASCYMPVASLKLGFETVRSQLRALAARLGLKDLKIECQTSQITDTQVPLNLQMVGDFAKAKRFILALHAFPHLAIKHAGFEVPTQTAEAQIEMQLNCQFKIEPQDNGGPHSLQAVANIAPVRRAGPR